MRSGIDSQRARWSSRRLANYGTRVLSRWSAASLHTAICLAWLLTGVDCKPSMAQATQSSELQLSSPQQDPPVNALRPTTNPAQTSGPVTNSAPLLNQPQSNQQPGNQQLSNSN